RRFVDRVYTEWEQAYCRSNILHLSGRWAAKEAVSKVLGLGVRGVGWREIEIRRTRAGQPTVTLHGRDEARRQALGLSARPARSVVEAIAGEDPNVTFFPLAEAQPGVIATGAAAQLTSGATEKTKALLLGPGLAHAPGTDDFVGAVLRNAKAIPTVIDADGLNALARTDGWPELLPAKTILTPHDGEAARLSGRVVPTGAARAAFAERHAREWNAVVVLKGPVTMVSDGKKTYVNDHPNPTLGIGGSGGALGGAVAAFLARGLGP